MALTLPTFTERDDYEKGFSAYFDKEIAPCLAEADETRLAALALVKKRSRIAYPVIAALILCCLLVGLTIINANRSGGKVAGDLIGMFFIGIIVLLAWVNQPAKDAISYEKELLVPKVAGFFGTFTYQNRGAVSYDDVLRGRIVPGGSAGVMATEALSGTQGGKQVDICHLSTLRHEGKRNAVVFAGFYVKISVTKKFSGVTVVMDGHEPHLSNSSDLQDVSLEDPDFARMYKVMSSDQIEARYLLAPDLMEHLKELSALHGNNWLQCSFIDQTLTIAIRTPAELFPTTSITSPEHDEEDVHIILTRLHSVLSVVDLLEDHLD
jgi:hypothetical protein